jgi:hypothetical protein
LFSRQQRLQPRGDDREQITRARQAAEALFRSKPPVSDLPKELIEDLDEYYDGAVKFISTFVPERAANIQISI